ncbi:hypothetical protein EYF80_019880 [Liparis tanakae]|uniref:Uncharacterized protein n=1 Tax=Liparis tanakae TaxID=230148 RepID=A0A4Z2HY04_9TELE|nr:hypothetical protein EYF80_019880 [Liparis tanakae]
MIPEKPNPLRNEGMLPAAQLLLLLYLGILRLAQKWEAAICWCARARRGDFKESFAGVMLSFYWLSELSVNLRDLVPPTPSSSSSSSSSSALSSASERNLAGLNCLANELGRTVTVGFSTATFDTCVLALGGTLDPADLWLPERSASELPVYTSCPVKLPAAPFVCRERLSPNPLMPHARGYEAGFFFLDLDLSSGNTSCFRDDSRTTQLCHLKPEEGSVATFNDCERGRDRERKSDRQSFLCASARAVLWISRAVSEGFRTFRSGPIRAQLPPEASRCHAVVLKPVLSCPAARVFAGEFYMSAVHTLL